MNCMASIPGRLRLMHHDGYFDERVAASYDRPDGEEFDPAVIEAIVDFLVERAGAGHALELIRCRDGSHCAPARAARGAGARDRPLEGDGREAACQARR